MSTEKLEPTVSILIPTTLPAPTPGPRLLVFLGGLPVPQALTKGKELVVGRGEVDVRIDDPSLSRKHAKLYVDDESVRVTDLGSKNGTRVRGVRVESETEIAPGELFHFGNIACVIERVSEARSAPTKKQTRAEQLANLVKLVAASDISVFIHGETGAGKEVTARAIHDASPRRDKPFVAFNCAALPENLVESELFGYEKGAFSGADRAKPGIIESAEGGTIFLDEIAEMSPLVQAKMLRVLEAREVQRLGALRPKAVDLRVISASHRLLDEEEDFRQDLYFRINGIMIEIPPLRDRVDELDGFAEQFLSDAAARMKRSTPKISPDALKKMRNYDWPGNLRELKNAMERALVLCAGADVVTAEHIPLTAKPKLDKTERERILDALRDAGGNQAKAAAILKMSRRTLINRLEQHGIPRPRKG